MACAGLRIGEAVALTQASIKRNAEICWADATLSRHSSGRYKDPKSGQGRVVIPEWLYSILIASKYPEILPNSLYKWMRRRGLQPHGLRHFYCTYLVRNVRNVEMARRQMGHRSLATTLSVYLEIESEDELMAIQGLVDPFEAQRPELN